MTPTIADSTPLDLTAFIRTIPDFPKAGILFRDIAPLLADPRALAGAIERLFAPWRNERIDAVAAIEARGFLFATPLAMALGVGLLPVRKPGKLPGATIAHEYELEYGSDRLEMHTGMLPAGARVLVVDDVLATGGTAGACLALIAASGATVAGVAFLIELQSLGGRKKLAPHRVESVLVY